VAYEQIPALVERGTKRAEVYFDKLETRLGASPFIASERFTYADIVGFVYLGFAVRALRRDPLEGRPALARWREAVAARPAIKSVP
jgi:glutathione S-transferase